MRWRRIWRRVQEIGARIRDFEGRRRGGGGAMAKAWRYMGREDGWGPMGTPGKVIRALEGPSGGLSLAVIWAMLRCRQLWCWGPWRPMSHLQKYFNFYSEQERIRATSHTSLKAHDLCNLRGSHWSKGQTRPSSLHTRRWRRKGPKKTSCIKSLHGVLHGRLWIRFMVSHNFYYFFNMINFMTNCKVAYKTYFRTYKHHQ